MTITEHDIQGIQTILNPMLGLKAWGVTLGVGSFVTLEFGREIPSEKPQGTPHGEWYLWIYNCDWRLEQGENVFAGSEDPREELKEVVRTLEGRILQSVKVEPPAFDTIFVFEDNLLLRTFTIYFRGDNKHWLLFTPNKKVLTVGPGVTWSFE